MDRRSNPTTASNRHCLWGSLIACFLLLVTAQTSAQGPTTEPGLIPGLPPAALPEPLQPKHGPTEADEDRVRTSTELTYGSLLAHRGQPAAALRHLQRAYRWSNGSQTILARLIPLAAESERFAEAIRYASLARSDTAIDPLLLRQLAAVAAELGDSTVARQLYQRTIGREQPDRVLGTTLLAHYEAGRLSFLDDDFAQAVRLLEPVRRTLEQATDEQMATDTALRLAKENAMLVYSVLGESYLKLKRPPEAEQAFGQLNDLQPDAALLSFHLARVAALQADLATNDADRTSLLHAAQQKLETYFASRQTDVGTEPYRVWLAIAQRLGDRDGGRKRLDQLAGEQPGNVYLNFFLAEDSLDHRQPEDAWHRLTRLLRVRPTLDGLQMLIAAGHALQDARAMATQLAPIMEQIGGENLIDLFESIDDQVFLERVVQELEEVSRRATGKEKTGALVAAAYLHLLLEQPTRAVTLYHQALEPTANPAERAAAQIAWALQLLIRNHPQLAIEELNQIDSSASDETVVARIDFYRSTAWSMLDQSDRALAAAERAAKAAPDQPEYLLRHAIALSVHGDTDQAIAKYRELIDKFDALHQVPELRVILREARRSLAAIYIDQQRAEEAEELLQTALDEYPNDPGLLNDLGYLWAERREHLGRAVRITYRAVTAEPENVAFRDSYGWALYRLGFNKEAAEQLARATDDEQPDPLILDHLAQVQLQLGQTDAALDTWRRAMKRLGSGQQALRQSIEASLARHAPQPNSTDEQSIESAE